MKLDRISSLLLLSVLSGVLLGLGHSPGTSIFGFFGLVPLIRIWCFAPTEDRDGRHVTFRRFIRGFMSGWIAQTLQFLIAAPWILHGIREFGVKDPVLSFGAFLTMVVVNGFAIPIAGGVACALAPRLPGRVSRVLFAAAAVALAEICVPSIIPAPLGHIALLSDVALSDLKLLKSTMPLVQLVDLIGLSGVSLLMALAAASLALGSRAGIGSALFVLLISNALGAVHGEAWLSAQEAGDEARLLLVQSSVSNEEKREIESPLVARAIVERQIAMTKKLLVVRAGVTAKPDLVVWPETAVPDALDEVYAGGVLPTALKEFVQETRVPLMTGAFSRDPRTHRESNAAFVFDANGKSGRPYLKTRLFPFAETVPLAKWFPAILRWFPQLSEYSNVPGQAILQVARIRGGMSICYEVLFDNFSRDAARSGANVLFNLSNEAWFGSESASLQFLVFARARAIEARLPLVRVSNYSNTIAIDPSGRMIGGLTRAEAGVLESQVEVRSQPETTFFVAWPWLTAAVAIVIGVLAIVFGRFAGCEPANAGFETSATARQCLVGFKHGSLSVADDFVGACAAEDL